MKKSQTSTSVVKATFANFEEWEKEFLTKDLDVDDFGNSSNTLAHDLKVALKKELSSKKRKNNKANIVH